MLGDNSVIIGVYFILIIACIIKEIWYLKWTNFDFLWLILYNDFLLALSIYALWTPSPNHVPGTRSGYLPGEFMIFTTIPLILIGLMMKMIFLSKKKGDQDNPTESDGKSSGGIFWYVFISWFPAWFTFGMAASRLMRLSMWLPLYFVGSILLPILLPLLPRLYQLIKRILIK